MVYCPIASVRFEHKSNLMAGGFSRVISLCEFCYSFEFYFKDMNIWYQHTSAFIAYYHMKTKGLTILAYNFFFWSSDTN